MCEIILLADNDVDFVETWSEYLREAEYEVIEAYNPENARRVLKEGRVHLALLDIRLLDDDDDYDVSGLTLARETAGDNIPKIILTRYQSYEYVRMALGPAADGLPATVNFIAKQEGPQVMLAAVRAALDKHQRINRQLKLIFNPRQPLLSLASLVAGMEADLNPAFIQDRIGEFKDLMRKLFFQQEQITVQQLLWQRGEHMALEVLAYGQGREELFIVTCGCRQRLQAEWEQYDRFVPRGVGLGVLTLYAKAETPHYGASAAAIQRAEGVGDDLKPFPAYYRSHTDKQVIALLEKLADHTVIPWHSGERDLLEGQSLRDWYRARAGLEPADFHAEGWRRRLDLLAKDCQRFGLPQVQALDGHIVLAPPGGRPLELADPLPYFCDDARLQPERVPVGFSLGEVEIDTLLTDRLGNAWFSEYCRAGKAPVWHDFVAMEASLRFSLVEGSNLLELANLERRLGLPARLGEPVSLADIDPDLRKLAACIQAVRAQAAVVAGPDPAPYLACLAYFCMDDLLRYDPGRRLPITELMAHLYRLVTAALACERAETLRGGGASPADRTARRNLEIDRENRLARIDGREVSLSQTEVDLFSYLYARRGQVCKREDILREVFKIKSTGSEQDVGLVNTNISRLRGKVEYDADNPTLILTVRGAGFRLAEE